jgi:fimbrial chaperone protein
MFLFLFLALVATAAPAADVVVSPTVLVAEPNRRTEAISIVNRGKAPVAYQVEVLRWHLVDGKDVLTPTREVIATPVRLEIPAGTTRVLRVMRLQGNDTAYYRIRVRELPNPAVKGPVQVLVQMLVPLAFERAGEARVLARRVPGGFVLSNAGTATARIALVRTLDDRPVAQEGLGWVFPGTERFVRMEQVPPALRFVIAGVPQDIAIP